MEKTLTERVKDIVRTVVLDKEYTKLQELSKQVQTELANDAKYQDMLKAVKRYELNAYINDDAFMAQCRSVLFSSVLGASKLERKIHIPEAWVQNSANIERLAKSTLINTDSRIASAIVALNATFEVKTKRNKANDTIPYTKSEIREFVRLINMGLMTRDAVRAQLRIGKSTKR